MILDKALLLKGLGGVTALGGTAAAVCFVVFNNDSDAKELKKSLGLPENDSDCKLPTNDNETTTCTLDTDKLKKIKFDGKGNNEPSIANGGTPTITLTITKTSDTTTYPKGGYKFAFQSNKDITISSASPAKYIKKNTNTEFKIKETTAEGGAKTLSLEKAWTVTKLAEKVGLTCPEQSTGSTEKKCTFTTENKINVKNDNDKIEGAKLKNSSDASSKKVTYEEDKENYNQGFKFYVEEDITLTKDTAGGTSSGDKTINKKGDNGSGAYYEIKEIDGQWYLAKYTASASQ